MTPKVELIGHYGDDLLVVNVARCSHDKWHDRFISRPDSSLIEYLAKNKHKSPFMHPKASFRLYMPIFIARQWERHRIGAIRQYDVYDMNEVSRRYVATEPEFFIPEYWRKAPDENIKQGSGEPLDKNANMTMTAKYLHIVQDSMAFYKQAINNGVAPEMARMALPQSMMTKWIETGSLYYWFNLCSLRVTSDAQKEIAEIAAKVYEAMDELFPISWKALTDNGVN